MTGLVDQKIAKGCVAELQDYAKNICSVTSRDTLHAYPYGCRSYAPGAREFASIRNCNLGIENNGGQSAVEASVAGWYIARNNSPLKKYTSCEEHYYLNRANEYGNDCVLCPSGKTCAGGIAQPLGVCGTYEGSLYQKLVVHALQNCVRPSISDGVAPINILADVSFVMDQITTAMVNELSKECTRLDGKWEQAGYGTNNMAEFQTQSNASTGWGTCSVPPPQLSEQLDD
jgi:hypothetical protein